MGSVIFLTETLERALLAATNTSRQERDVNLRLSSVPLTVFLIP
jgi:hypothetical protein